MSYIKIDSKERLHSQPQHECYFTLNCVHSKKTCHRVALQPSCSIEVHDASRDLFLCLRVSNCRINVFNSTSRRFSLRRPPTLPWWQGRCRVSRRSSTLGPRTPAPAAGARGVCCSGKVEDAIPHFTFSLAGLQWNKLVTVRPGPSRSCGGHSEPHACWSRMQSRLYYGSQVSVSDTCHLHTVDSIALLAFTCDSEVMCC